MTIQGCFGVRVCGVDKLIYSGANSQPSILGINLINELSGVINRKGYDSAIEYWLRNSINLRLVEPSDPLDISSFEYVFFKGQGKSAKIINDVEFILASWLCAWAYIMNLETEMFEIYKGHQLKKHSSGRFSSCLQFAHEWNHRTYPCALMTEIPLKKLSDFDFKNWIIEDSQMEVED